MLILFTHLTDCRQVSCLRVAGRRNLDEIACEVDGKYLPFVAIGINI